ncbi:FAD-dependent oxidoreductase [Streptomyces hydrogenans]|uniref:FAD-dependent oxidoreductase n=1 Tax=Streptomyces hydrogenans TaxID=1873719 RepID=UPI0035D8EEA5
MTAPRTTDVVVIGAGVSGVSAARRPAQADRPVVVIEAGDRVGGRTMNLDVADGVITEGGGQRVGPGQDRVLALMDALGLETPSRLTSPASRPTTGTAARSGTAVSSRRCDPSAIGVGRRFATRTLLVPPVP